jgi:hypothetical protein
MPNRGHAEVSWLGVVARGAFPLPRPEAVANAAELALTVAGAAPVSHRTSLSHRGCDAITTGVTGPQEICYSLVTAWNRRVR